MKTKPKLFAQTSGRFLRPWRPGVMMLLATLFLAGTTSTRAAKSVFERTKPHVNVGTIGRIELDQPLITFDFAAEVQTDGAGRASGVVQFAFMDGSVRNLAPVAGTMHLEGQQLLVFFLLLPYLPSGELDATQPVTALVSQDVSTRVDTILWQVEGSGFDDGPLHFEAPGQIEVIPKSESQLEVQGSPWFSLYYRPQPVAILGTDLKATFSASAKVLGDHTASGLIELALPEFEHSLRFAPVYGVADGTQATGPVYIILLLDGAPLLFDNLAVATIRPDPALPGCDIWDFASNAALDSRLHLQFDAAGRIKFFE